MSNIVTNHVPESVSNFIHPLMLQTKLFKLPFVV